MVLLRSGRSIAESEFPVTSWTLIRNAAHNREALARLCELYRRPVQSFFLSMVGQVTKAEDLCQDFFAEKIIGDGRLLGRADRHRGKRFRSYLMTAMRRFAIDLFRQSRKESQPGNGVDFDGLPARVRSAVREFEREWATTVVALTLDRVKASCQKRNMHRQWTVFEARKVRPILLGVEAMPFEEVARQVEARDRGEVDAILQKMNHKFQRTLRQVAAETIDSDDAADIGREIDQLKEFLSIR